MAELSWGNTTFAPPVILSLSSFTELWLHAGHSATVELTIEINSVTAKPNCWPATLMQSKFLLSSAKEYKVYNSQASPTPNNAFSILSFQSG